MSPVCFTNIFPSNYTLNITLTRQHTKERTKYTDIHKAEGGRRKAEKGQRGNEANGLLPLDRNTDVNEKNDTSETERGKAKAKEPE